VSASTSLARRPPGVILLTDARPEPWVNGAGTTRVLQQNERWRVSVAEIAGRVPFSLLAGIERTLIPLSSTPLAITVDGVRKVVRTHTPVAFPGEAKVDADTNGSRIEVVNVMTPRASSRLVVSVDSGIAVPVEHADALLLLSGTADIAGWISPSPALLLADAIHVAKLSTDAVVARLTVRATAGVPG
jgi:environmental stress-induced protein Ves